MGDDPRGILATQARAVILGFKPGLRRDLQHWLPVWGGSRMPKGEFWWRFDSIDDAWIDLDCDKLFKNYWSWTGTYWKLLDFISPKEKCLAARIQLLSRQSLNKYSTVYQCIFRMFNLDSSVFGASLDVVIGRGRIHANLPHIVVSQIIESSSVS